SDWDPHKPPPEKLWASDARCDDLCSSLVEACWNTTTKSPLTPLPGSSRATSSATLKRFCRNLNGSLHVLRLTVSGTTW
ncbi:MAG: hypothetical protein VCA34_05565, partial [Roseibacillus sp.]